MKKGTLGWLMALFFAIILVQSSMDYVRGNVVHYSGSSVITNDQFVSFLSKSGTVKVDDWQIMDGGKVLLKNYDFYAPSGVTYLTTKPYSLWDVPAINGFRGKDWVSYGLFLVFIVVTFSASLTALRLRGIRVNDRQLNGYISKLASYTIKIWDNFSKDELGEAHLVKTINISNMQGIIAVRYWTALWGTSLRSVAQGAVWDDRLMAADKIPETDNANGMYALRLGATSVSRIEGLVMGIVELTGRYEYHGDGIIRGERCEIKLLLCHSGFQKKGRALSVKYKVPVYFTNDPLVDYHRWLFSENGMECLKHNYDLLGQPSIHEEVKHILEG